MFALIVIAAVVVGVVTGAAEAVTNGELQAAIEGLVKVNEPLAVGVYCIFTIVGCVLLALPGSLFAIAAAALFGPMMGTLWCSLSATVGAVLAFVTARFFLRDIVRPRVMRNKIIRRWLFEGSRRNELVTLAVTRLVPVFPFNLQNFAYGVTDMPLSVYTLGTFLFIIPGTALYAFGTAGILDEQGRVPFLVTTLVLAILVVAVGTVLARHFGLNNKDAGAEEQATQERISQEREGEKDA